MKTSFKQAALEHIASRGSKETRSIYKTDLARWLTFCELENVDPDAPPFSAALKFRDELNKKFAALTVRRVLAELSGMYEAAELTNHFRSNKKLPRPSEDDVALTPAFTEEEAKLLLKAAAKHLRDRTIIQVLYDTGLRITEVLSMRRDQLVTMDGNTYLVARVKKRGRVETAIPKTSADAIAEWLKTGWIKSVDGSSWVFPGRNPCLHLSRQTFSARLAELGRSVGIENAHAHRFRATYITSALDAGIPLHEIRAAVHHSNINMTMRYDRSVRGTGVSAALAEYRSKK